MLYRVNVLCDSVTAAGANTRLTTVALQVPRVVLAEFNTHRTHSRNTESSRAVPVEHKIALTEANPYIPGDLPDGPLMGNNPGMEAHTLLSDWQKGEGQRAVCNAARYAARLARRLLELGWHKQDVNRYLEPFSWTRIVASSTLPGWINFFALRCDTRAYPPLRFLARAVWVALSRSTPAVLTAGDWHLPFVTAADRAWAADTYGDRPQDANARGMGLAKVSAARCGRVSYYHFGRKPGDPVSYGKDLELYAKLTGGEPMHASPLEHPARAYHPAPSRKVPPSNFLSPWVQLRKLVPREVTTAYTPDPETVAGWNVPDEVFAPLFEPPE